MNLASQRWLKIVFLVTAVVFVGVAVSLYAVRFFDWVESDAAVASRLAAKMLHERSPIVSDWYYANGDIWGLAPQLFALLPVAIFGPGPASLLIAVLSGFLLEVAVFAQIYRRISGEVWIGLFAMMGTLMAWSNAHVAFEYIQLAYGFVTCLYLVAFYSFARMADGPLPARWKLAGVALLIALISVQNPVRGLVFVVAPVLGVCVWPWRTLPIRRRLLIAGITLVGWGAAFVTYRWLLSELVTFSVPRGHIAFAVGNAARIKTNLAMLGHGLLLLCGGGSEPGLRSIPGAVLLLGALTIVVREIWATRELTAQRFLSVIALLQFGVVLFPLIIGNLLVAPESVRYLMPNLLIVLGFAVMIAVRTVTASGMGWASRFAIGWLVVVPIAALAAIPDTSPPKPERYRWPDTRETSTLADELVRRGLTHGFSNVLTANLLTLDSGGKTLTCPIYFRAIIMPQRWLTDTSCYTRSALPERFYVVADQAEHDRNAIGATLPPAVDHFSVGPTYEVYVYSTSSTPLEWLDLPVADGDLATFPMRLPATHLQVLRGKVRVEGTELVATGEGGTVLYGPYIDLPRGEYTVTWIGNGIESPGRLAFTATADGAQVLGRQVTLPAKEIPPGRSELAKISFTLGRPRKAIEFLVESGDGGRVSIHEILIERSR